jgi:hypothetical protein
MINDYRITQKFLKGTFKGQTHTFVMYSDPRFLYKVGTKIAGGEREVISIENLGPYCPSNRKAIPADY